MAPAHARDSAAAAPRYKLFETTVLLTVDGSRGSPTQARQLGMEHQAPGVHTADCEAARRLPSAVRVLRAPRDRIDAPAERIDRALRDVSLADIRSHARCGRCAGSAAGRRREEAVRRGNPRRSPRGRPRRRNRPRVERVSSGDCAATSTLLAHVPRTTSSPTRGRTYARRYLISALARPRSPPRRGCASPIRLPAGSSAATGS